MRKAVVPCLASAALVILAYSFLPHDPLTTEERAWLKANDGKIRIAPEKDYPPTAFIDSKGRFAGISADIIHLIERRLGFHFKILPPKDLYQILGDIRSENADVTTAVRDTPDRSEYMLFTAPYLNFKSVIVVRRQVQGNLEPKDLIGKRVGVGQAYAVQEFLRRHYPGLNIVPSVNDTSGLRDLSLGVLDAYVVDSATAGFLIDRERISNLRIAGETGFNHSLSIGSRKQQIMLHSILQKGLSLITDEEIEGLWKKWAPFDEKHPFYHDPLILRLVATLLLLAVVGIVGVFVWNRSLSHKVKEQTAQLKEALAVREDFVAIAAHELRTPLTALKLQLELLSMLLRDADFPEKDRLLQLYRNSNRQLGQFSEMIEDLLDVSQMGREGLKLEVRPVDFSQLVSEVLQQYDPEFKAVGCQLLISTDPSIQGCWDQARVAQVVRNLVSNAIKYGAGAPVEITTTTEGQQAKLVVRDHGIGLAKQDIEKIFNRFGRAVPSTQYRGFGLGLYITQQIVQAHGGTIVVESEPGHGASFIVTLPLKVSGLTCNKEPEKNCRKELG